MFPQYAPSKLWYSKNHFQMLCHDSRLVHNGCVDEALARIDHPGVVKVLDRGQGDGGNINALADRVVGNSVPVQERQRCVRSDAAQVHCR